MSSQTEISSLSSRLIPWETKFRGKLANDKPESLTQAGYLLSVIPSHQQWDIFLEDIRSEWTNWQRCLDDFPYCLVVLFGGVAFFEYQDNTFWPQFATAVGTGSIDPNKQRQITTRYSDIISKLGLKLLHGQEASVRSSYVGSAIYHIGVPLSLWAGFLDICEWVLWRDDWTSLDESDWAEAVGKRTGGRQRLKTFLIDNREGATASIREILDARKVLIDEPSLSIADLSRISILRAEYFDEVPETAEFLRPKDPDSLFQDHARLVWNEQRSCITLHLPGLSKEALPATWRVGPISSQAASAPDELVLDSIAFADSLHLELESGQQTETQRLRGVQPWGLFDVERGGYLVNSDRDQLPLRSCYVLVSRTQIENITRVGFEEQDYPVNEPFELSDGTSCYVTRLSPTGKSASLQFKHEGKSASIGFRGTSRIESRFYAGVGYRAAFFERSGEIAIEHLPALCIAIPSGYFLDNGFALRTRFSVLMDGKSASGTWDMTRAEDDREIYTWKWDEKPFIEKRKSGKFADFKELPSYFRSPDLRGKRTLSIEAHEFKSLPYNIYLDHSKKGVESAWKNLPGAYLEWFLLCQSTEGMKWEDLMLARDVIAPGKRVSYYLLRKYEDFGLLSQRNRRWYISESRAMLRPLISDKVILDYCGNPSILWRLYRRFSGRSYLPVIEVVDKRGRPVYLQMIWDSRLEDEIREYLKKKHVQIGKDLWNP